MKYNYYPIRPLLPLYHLTSVYMVEIFRRLIVCYHQLVIGCILCLKMTLKLCRRLYVKLYRYVYQFWLVHLSIAEVGDPNEQSSWCSLLVVHCS